MDGRPKWDWFSSHDSSHEKSHARATRPSAGRRRSSAGRRARERRRRSSASTIERDVLLASLSRVVVVVVVASDARGDRVEIEAQFRRVGRASRVGLGRPPRWTNDDWWLRRMGRRTREEDARASDECETRGRKKLFSRRRVRLRVAPRRRRSVRRCVTGRAIARFDRSRVVHPPHSRRLAHGWSRAWTIIRDDARARRRATTRRTTRRAIPKIHRADRVVSRVIARRVRRRSTHPSIHPRARAPSPAVVRPPARRLIFHAQTARHTRAGSRSTPTSGPAGHHPTYFDGVKCYLFRVDDTVSASTTTRLWTLYTMVDLVHDT